VVFMTRHSICDGSNGTSNSATFFDPFDRNGENSGGRDRGRRTGCGAEILLCMAVCCAHISFSLSRRGAFFNVLV
jgi:hypothetical protein